MAMRQKRVFRLFQTQAQPTQLAAQNRARLLPKIGNLHDVTQNIVAIVAQQRIRVEHDRADRTHEHDVQTKIIQKSRLAKPPDERRDRSQHQFHIHPRRADGRAMPTVGQHPRIRHVAIQTGGQYQKHDPHLMTFAAEMFARHAVPEFVNDFGDAQHPRHQHPVLGREKRIKRRQFRLKHVELDDHQQQRAQR